MYLLFGASFYVAAQVVGMGSAVTAEVPAAKELYDRASNILGYDLYDKVSTIFLF